MPEGDTVWRACQRLNEVLAGRALTRCEFRVPTLATTDLTGVGVREVVSRGKHQLFRFANDHTLHTHFRMDGTWRIYPSGRKWSGGPEFQIRAVLATAEHSCVGYRLPVVELIPTADEEDVVGHLGPDLLGPDWDLDEAVRRISRRPRPQHRRGPAGPAQPGRHRHLLPGRAAVPAGHPPAYAGPRGRQPPPGGPARSAAAVRQPLADRAVDDRRPAARTGGRTSSSGPGSPAAAAAPRSAPRSSGPLGQERRSYWCPRCQPER